MAFGERLMKKHDPVRRANAVLAAFLLLFFFAHAWLAAAKVCGVDLGETFKWTVWVGVGIIAAHVLLSLRTTYTMFTDQERPASPKKRAHQMLKWITGAVLALTVLFHFPTEGTVPLAYALSLIVAAAALAWHSWTGTKSLTRDLSLPLAARTVVRIVVCVAAAAITIALLLSH